MAESNNRVDSSVAQTVRYLTHAFGNATQHLGKNASRGTVLHKLQVDFAYILDNITRSPAYIVPKFITEANELIEKAAEMPAPSK